MTSAESRWSEVKAAVTEALDLPATDRHAYLDTRFPDPARRVAATRLLRACEEAATSPVLGLSAAEFAAPVLAEVHEQERGVPEALREALAGRYTIERELGRGGMARVYLARDERHGRLVALKLLRPELVSGAGPTSVTARFQREIEIAAGLSHPHILPLYDSGEAGGLLYYITPYVDGETLRDRLKRVGRLPLAEVLHLLRHVARALAHAHRQGVVHRDIKPENILLNHEGDALVADFGVAKALAAAQSAAGVPQPALTDGTFVLGTPAYMSPEQVTGDPGIDHRTDLYSFGAVAYELLTGTAPFAGRPRHEQLAAHLSELPESVAVRQSDVPESASILVGRLLAKDPGDRPRDASEVLRVLDAAAEGPSRTVEDLPRGESAAATLPRRSSWRAYMVGAAALLAIVAWAMLARDRMTARAAPLSIAVLPFDAIGDSSAVDHLAVGLSDGIGTDLGRLERVVAPGYLTVSDYRGTRKSLAQIGSELGVRAVLRGRVKELDGRVRVEAELLDPRSGVRLWERNYEGPSSGIQEVQRDIERAVLEELRIRPSGSERELLDRIATTNGRAYDAYLRGRAIELAGGSREEPWHLVPADNIRRAQSLYSRARDLDPRFAPARARLALMHALAAATYDTTEARREQVRVEAETALRLVPGLPEAHEALASYWGLQGEPGRAIDELGLALESFPHSADLHLALGQMLWRAGRAEDAADEFHHAMRLEPTNPKAAYLTARSYSRLRRREEAMRAFDRAIALAPDYHMVKVIKGQAYLRWYGVSDTLATAMRNVSPDWDPDGMGTYARYSALWVQRRYAEALAMLDRTRSELSQDGLVYQPTSLMRARLQDGMEARDLARASYAIARDVLQDSADARPDDPSIRVALALALAGLGRNADAVREARHAMQLAPIGSGDAAPAIMGEAVQVFATAGEIDAACDLLELLFSMPAGREVTVPFLRAWPGFDPLRSEPCFEELLTRFSSAP